MKLYKYNEAQYVAIYKGQYLLGPTRLEALHNLLMALNIK